MRFDWIDLAECQPAYTGRPALFDELDEYLDAMRAAGKTPDTIHLFENHRIVCDRWVKAAQSHSFPSGFPIEHKIDAYDFASFTARWFYRGIPLHVVANRYQKAARQQKDETFPKVGATAR